MRRVLRFIGLILLSVFSIVFFTGVYYGFIRHDSVDSAVVYGVSFNSEYANYLGLDDGKVFTSILDDWHFRYIRLSAQWNLLEPKKGEYDFRKLDWQMDEAQKRHAKVIIAVGQKTPRWPECHIPGWTLLLSEPAYRQALNQYITTVIQRYRNHPALEMWQIENEPFLDFGVCPAFTETELKQEIAIVKTIDTHHPTLTSDSGELSMWFDTGHATDFFGTTLYRVVWNQWLGYMNYNWVPADAYKLKMLVSGVKASRMFVTELQAEPWIAGKPFSAVPVEEQYQSMNLAQLKKNVTFAATLGVPRAYLWGAEWWYWLREHGVTDIPDYISSLKKE